MDGRAYTWDRDMTRGRRKRDMAGVQNIFEWRNLDAASWPHISENWRLANLNEGVVEGG